MIDKLIVFIRRKFYAYRALRWNYIRRLNLPPRSHMEVKAFRSRQIVVAIEANGQLHKIFQILFSKDGSLYVTFPYFAHKEGILSVVTVMGPPGSTSNIDLADTGKVASHLIKYSHHPDGRAHFSQDAKVRTEIRKKSVALNDQHGHIFTVIVQGLAGFTPLKTAKDNAQRTTVTFDIPDRFKRAFRIVGRWYWLEDLHVKPRPPVIGPNISCIDGDGNKQDAFIVASPNDRTEHVLLLTCSFENALDPRKEVLIFYGGFNPPAVILNPRKSAGFLAFLYPVDNFEALKKQIGSIDFTNNPARIAAKAAMESHPKRTDRRSL